MCVVQAARKYGHAQVRTLTALVGNVTKPREELVSTDVCLEDRPHSLHHTELLFLTHFAEFADVFIIIDFAIFIPSG